MAFWTCVRTEAQRESVAVRHLELEGFTIYLPRLRAWRVTRGRKVETHPPLFACYVFTLIEARWYAARYCIGVAGMIMDGVTPAKVPDSIITELKGRERNGLIELPTKQGLQRGDKVKILRGPFQGHLAIYSDMKPRERVEVLLALLGNVACPVSLPRADVEPVRLS